MIRTLIFTISSYNSDYSILIYNLIINCETQAYRSKLMYLLIFTSISKQIKFDVRFFCANALDFNDKLQRQPFYFRTEEPTLFICLKEIHILFMFTKLYRIYFTCKLLFYPMYVRFLITCIQFCNYVLFL